MIKINLQLFALKLNTNRSVVDSLKSAGQDSSYGNRKKLAAQKNGQKTNSAAAETVALEIPEVAPVQQNTGFTPTAVPTFTPTQTSTPEFVQNAAPKYKGQTSQAQQAEALEQRLPADTLAAINSQFQVSQAYQQAMDYTNSLLQQLNGGKTSYTDQISQLLEQYQKREKFSYDADSDHFKYMIAGRGGCKVFSVTKTIEEGSGT